MQKKAGAKLNALNRVAQCMNTEKKALNHECFFLSKFNYSSLNWIFHNGSLNHKINRLNEICLCVIYNDRDSSYDE